MDGAAVRCRPRPRMSRRPRAPRRADPVPPPRRRQRAAAEAKPSPKRAADGDIDDDEFENQMSLAAIEAELKPKVVETFDKIADNYKKLRRLQEQDISNQLQNETLSPAQERKYRKLKDEIIVEVKSLRLNQACIDFAGRAALRHQQEAGVVRGPPAASGRQPRRRARRLPAQLPGLGARSALAQPRLEALGQGLEEFRPSRKGPHQGTARRDPVAGGARPGSRSANSARSCTACRRASARRARPRRKWSRPICGW